MKKRVMAILIALLLAAALVPGSVVIAATYQLSDDLFPNGDFETLKEGSAIEPEAWVPTAAAGATNVAGTNYTVITDDAGVKPVSNDKALKLTMGESTTGRIMLTATIDPSVLELGSTYVLSGYIKLVNVYSGALILAGNGKNILQWIQLGSTTESITTEWKAFSNQFTYSSTYVPTSGGITFEAKVSGGGTMYLDGISLYKVNTLLTKTIGFEPTFGTDFTSSVYDPMGAYKSDSGCKINEEYTMELYDNNYAVHWHGINQTSVKGLKIDSTNALSTTKLSALTEGTPLKLSFRIKLTKADVEADANGNYAIKISHKGTAGVETLGTYYIPKSSLNQWVVVEYWYSHYAAYTGTQLIIKQAAVAGIDFLMDDVKLYAEDDSSISTGAVLVAKAANLTPKDSEVTIHTYTRTSLETEAPTRESKLSPGVFFLTESETEKSAQAITGVYMVENGLKTLKYVYVEELTASVNAPAMSATSIDLDALVLSADKNYVLETFLWDGLGTMSPLTNKTIVPILAAE